MAVSEILDVALMARPLADDDFGGAGLAHRDCRADNDRGMGVDGRRRARIPRGWA